MNNWVKAFGGTGVIGTLAATAPVVLALIVLVLVAAALWLASDRTRAESWSIMVRGVPTSPPGPPPEPRRKRRRLRRGDGPP